MGRGMEPMSQELQELVAEAMKNPGVAEAMAAFSAWSQANDIYSAGLQANAGVASGVASCTCPQYHHPVRVA